MNAPRDALDLTVSEAAARLYYGAGCNTCGEVRHVDLAAVAERLGPSFPLRDLRARLKCAHCGAPPIITTHWREATTSHALVAHWKPPRTATTVK